MFRGHYLLENKNAVSWVLLVLAVAIHVLDEALTGFLDFYNPMVLALRDKFDLFPMPTFSFAVWISGLIVALAFGFALTPLINRGSRFMRILSTIIGIIMIGNGLGHMLGSLYFERLLPGFWSSPLLLASATYMVIRGFRGTWQYRV